MESLAGRVGILGVQLEPSPLDVIEQLRSELAHTTSAMADKLQILEANVMLLETSVQGAIDLGRQIAQNSNNSPEKSSGGLGSSPPGGVPGSQTAGR